VEGANDGIGGAQQLQIKRARMRVEILKQESDPRAKYELFQRLNTGGDNLSEQEIRNCVGIMLNQPFQHWLSNLADEADFRATISQTSRRPLHTKLPSPQIKITSSAATGGFGSTYDVRSLPGCRLNSRVCTQLVLHSPYALATHSWCL